MLNPSIAENKIRLEAVLSAISDAIIVIDTNGAIMLVNQAALSIWQYTEDAVVEKPVDMLFAISDVFFLIERIIQDGIFRKSNRHTFPIVLKGQRKDGEIFPVETIIFEAQLPGNMEYILIANDVTQRNSVFRARDSLMHTLADSKQRLEEVTRKLVIAQEEERHRVALDLHDGIGQQITALRMEIDSYENGATGEEKTRISRQLDAISASLRNISSSLRPMALDHFGLIEAFVDLVEQFKKRSDASIDFKYSVQDANVRFNAEVETAVYRIGQEALTNAVKHAQASNISLRFTDLEDSVVIMVIDNGVGFNVDATLTTTESIGLRGMIERVNLLGGTIDFSSDSKLGTSIVAEIPI